MPTRVPVLSHVRADTLIALVLSVAAAAMLVLTGAHSHAVRTAAAADSASYVAPTLQQAPAPERVTLYGDSYSAGVGASDLNASYVSLLAAHEHWLVNDLANGGTGYVVNGLATSCATARCPTYQQAIAGDTTDPAVVVVAGGRNDATAPQDEISGAVDRFYRALRARYPHARIIAVSPIWDSRTPPPILGVIQADVRRAVESVHGTYLDIGEPLRGHSSWIIADGVHPNDRGHLAIAEAIERALARSTS